MLRSRENHFQLCVGLDFKTRDNSKIVIHKILSGAKIIVFSKLIKNWLNFGVSSLRPMHKNKIVIWFYIMSWNLAQDRGIIYDYFSHKSIVFRKISVINSTRVKSHLTVYYNLTAIKFHYVRKTYAITRYR